MTAGIGLATVATLTGCGNPVGPEDVAGTFAMTSVLPSIQVNGVTARALADTFFVAADGSGTRRTTVEQTPLAGGPSVIVVRVTDFSFRIEGDLIGFLWQCPPGVACLAMARRDWYELGVGARTMRSRDATRAKYVHIGAPVP